jgi:hypothetical protein
MELHSKDAQLRLDIKDSTAKRCKNFVWGVEATNSTRDSKTKFQKVASLFDAKRILMRVSAPSEL